MNRRPVAIGAALLLTFGLVSAAHAAGDPPGTVRLTPSTGGSVRDSLGALTGSADALVYDRDTAVGSVHLVATTDTGRTVDLGVASSDEEQYGLVGDTLSRSQGHYGHVVLWWYLSDASHGSVTLPSGDTYVTGAPGGFVYRRAERLFRRTVSGVTYDLGRPFAGQHPTAIADGQGLLALSGSSAKYLQFGHPNDFHSLDTGGHTLICPSIASGFAACADQVGTPVLLSLDGRAPRVLNGVHALGPRSMALSGSTIVVVVVHRKLMSRSYSSSMLQISSARYDLPTVSALGAAIETLPRDNTTLVSVTSAAATPKTAVVGPYGPPYSASVSLSPGQAISSDDRAEPGVPAGQPGVYRTPMSTSAPHLSVGNQSVIDTANPYKVLASGTTTVSVRATGNTMIVRGPQRTRTITGVNNTWVSVSGNRVLYLDASSSPPDFVYRIYDVATNTITNALANGPAFGGEAVIDGNHVAYVADTGAVEYENVMSGATTQVSAPLTSSCGTGEVFAAGDYVGWALPDYVPADEGCEPVYGYRDVDTMTPAVTPDGPVVSMSASGPVIDRTSDREDVLETTSGVVALLPAAAALVGPVVSGRTQAWLGSDRAAKVAPVSITPAVPRFETDPVVLPAAGGTVLHDYAPYSQPLTACSVTITNSAQQQVATLPCDSSETPFGVAEFSWDGQTGGNPAPAGTYTYSITAAGDGGAAQDADGTTSLSPALSRSARRSP